MFSRQKFLDLKNNFFAYIPLKMSASIEDSLLESVKALVPCLNKNKYKGIDGRIGIIGGSLEYSGAPYFAAMGALRTGADLVHIFCCKEASNPIKSFSPELIIHPVLDNDDALNLIKPWLERLHIIIIGPGLGRDNNVLNTVKNIIVECRALSKPLVIDADGLFLITQDQKLIANYPCVVLTPNIAEYNKLVKKILNNKTNNISEETTIQKLAMTIGENVLIVKKGRTDVICSGCKDILTVVCKIEGSGRRCGGQGDLLSGSLAVFLYWAIKKDNKINSKIMACYAACRLIRECNAAAFDVKGRGMLTTDMIDEVAPTFAKLYEIQS